MAEVRFEGRIDRQMYIDAQRLYLKPGGRGVVLLVLAILLIGYGVIGVPLVQGSRPSAGAIAGVPAFMALWLVFLWVISPIMNARRVERTNKMFGIPLRGVAKEAGLHLESEFGTSEFPWAVFFRFKMTDALVILYQSAHAFHIFPRSFFSSDEDWQVFRACVAEKVPARPWRKQRASV
jgi:YcxB-like protein